MSARNTEPRPGDPTGTRAPEPRRGLAFAVVGYLVALGLSGLFGGLALGAGAAPHGVLVVVASLAGLWTGLVAVTLLAVRSSSRHVSRHDIGLDVEARDLLLGAVAGLVGQLVVVPLLTLPARLVHPDRDFSAEARAVFEDADGLARVVLVVLVVFGAPLVEELFFRGTLQRAAVRRFGPMVGVLFVAAFFAATHFELVQFLPLFGAGLLFGVLAQRYDRLGPAITAHIVFNATTVAALMLGWV